MAPHPPLGRSRALVGALAILSAVVLILAGLALRKAGVEAQRRLAVSRELSAQSEKIVDRQPELAILLGLESLSLARDEPNPQPARGLVTGLARVTRRSRTLSASDPSEVAFSPDGRLLASTSAYSIMRWDVATGKPHGSPLRGHTDDIHSVAFGSDGKLLASASQDETVRLWDVATGRPHGAPLRGHIAEVSEVAFSPDGKLLASAGADSIIRLWNVATGRPHGAPLRGHTDIVWDVAVSPDGKLLASASGDKTIRLWDMATGRPHGAPLRGHIAEVSEVAFSPDGKLLASAGRDEATRVWDVPSGVPHGSPLTGHTDAVVAVAFSPDGRLLASASWDNTVRLWRLDFASRLRLGCRIVDRNLSLKEWRRFVPGIPYEKTCPGLPSGEGAPSDAPGARYPRNVALG